MSDVPNVDQLAAWDGDEGAQWAAHQEHYDGTVRAHSQLLADVAAISASEHVLDLGCGNGSTTCDAARAAADGTALGIDLSSAMLDNARRRAAEAGLTNVTFVQGDAQVHDFGADRFDVVISRFGAMFFSDPVAAFSNVAGATRAGGRLALVAWQRLQDNEWLTGLRGALAQGRDLPVPPAGAPGPFGFADPGRVVAILGEAGYREVRADEAELPVRFGADTDDAFGFVSDLRLVRALLAELYPDRQRTPLDDLRAVLQAHEGADGVEFGSLAWVVTARR